MSLETYMRAQIEAMAASMDRDTLQDPVAYGQAAMDWIVHHAAAFRSEWEQKNLAS
jgi:hypothetical protein